MHAVTSRGCQVVVGCYIPLQNLQPSQRASPAGSGAPGWDAPGPDLRVHEKNKGQCGKRVEGDAQAERDPCNTRP